MIDDSGYEEEESHQKQAKKINRQMSFDERHNNSGNGGKDAEE